MSTTCGPVGGSQGGGFDTLFHCFYRRGFMQPQATVSAVPHAGHKSKARFLILVGGSILIAAGAVILLATIWLGRHAAWELPAFVMLTVALAVLSAGIAAWIAGVTARSPDQGSRRLMRMIVLSAAIACCLVSVDLVLRCLEPDRNVDPWAAEPGYDPRPFLTTAPVCETNAPGVSPDEAHYPPDRTLHHRTCDFDVMVHTDSRGLRAIGREPAEPVTLAIGDSFCFGWGVADGEAYAARLGWHNAGIWGRPIPTHLKALRWWAPRLHPRRVIWEIYPPHLITELPDNWQGPYQYDCLRDGPGRAVLDAFYATGTGRFLFQRFGLAINRANYFTKEMLLYGEPSPELQAVYQQVQQCFVDARKLEAEFGFTLYFALAPSKRAAEMSRSRPDRSRIPFDRIRSCISGAGFMPDRVIDLLPVFKDSPDSDRLYFNTDMHWTPEGHRRVADRLAGALSIGADTVREP